MIQITDPKMCCGCTACASICTHDAITMKPDVLGFLYPEVDKNKCVNCGLCDKVCAFSDNYDCSHNLPVPVAYGVRHKNIKEIETSRSGAAFIAFSDWILAQGGIVYGAGYTDHFRVVHKRATTKQERDEFKGSKYTQSDLTGVFHQVRQDLKDGHIVLFSGTPCQTAGLNSFIGKKFRENLYLVDIVCHGVPSPYIWRDNLSLIRFLYHSEIEAVSFRDKSIAGWRGHIESYLLDNGIKVTSDRFTALFYKHIMLRLSCGNCHYCNIKRPADMTIADFWGWEKTCSTFNKDNKGVSLVLINTEKGKMMWEKIKENVNYIEAQISNVLQDHLKEPSVISLDRVKFESYYKRYGFFYVFLRYTLNVRTHRVKYAIKFLLQSLYYKMFGYEK